ncbi:MAG TPA: nuclear transport factor 2 family protein [Dehalococcoidia bacterium]|jgi:ketosteroid isomerase-like protein|nr:nuclear transport factor 2 family protein [Dehalococcoidia bacterium]
MSNVDTVKQIYEAFGRGDIPAIIDKLDANVEWDTDYDSPAAPWLQPRRGAANIPGFFESLAPLAFTKFEPHTFGADGNRVVAVIHVELDSKGKHYIIPNEGHYWVFNDQGKVTKFQHLTDTALHWRVANGQ